MKIFIADDHQLVIDGFKSVLADVPNVEVVGEATDGNDLLRYLESPEADTDIILLDIDMPGMNGLDAMKVIQNKYPELLVLVVTMHRRADYILRMKNSGVAGYIAKNTGKQELILALETICSGKTYFSRGVERELEDARRRELLAREGLVLRFTKREKEILALIATGLKSKEIADHLNISESTVLAHRKNLKSKAKSVLGIETMMGIVSWAREEDLL